MQVFCFLSLQVGNSCEFEKYKKEVTNFAIVRTEKQRKNKPREKSTRFKSKEEQNPTLIVSLVHLKSQRVAYLYIICIYLEEYIWFVRIYRV